MQLTASQHQIRKSSVTVALLCTVIALALMPVTLQAAEPVSKSRLGGVAIGGHDVVAYHHSADAASVPATKGLKSYTVKYKGAKWRFVDADSAAKFRANPERYSPAYNGHCANALSLGKGLVRTDGTHWEIFGEQLYLFYAASGRDRWVSVDDIAAYKAAADAEWQRLVRP